MQTLDSLRSPPQIIQDNKIQDLESKEIPVSELKEDKPTTIQNDLNETKQELEEKEKKETPIDPVLPVPVVPLTEEEKKKQAEELQQQQEIENARLKVVNDPQYNACWGEAPSQSDIHENLYPLVQSIPPYKQHIGHCPLNPDSNARLLIHTTSGIAMRPSFNCNCCTALAPDLTPTQQKVFDNIHKKCMYNMVNTSDACYLYTGRSGNNLTVPLAMSVVQRALFLEIEINKQLQKGKLRGSRGKPKDLDDIQVYVQDDEDQEDKKIPFFYQTCKEQLERNGRNVTKIPQNTNLGVNDNSSGCNLLLFKHPASEISILIRINNHTDMRKSWTPFPASNIFLDDALVRDRNTPYLREFIALSAFGRSPFSVEVRRTVIIAVEDDFKKAQVGEHDLLSFRAHAHDLQIHDIETKNKQKAAAEQERMNLLEKFALAKLNHNEHDHKEEEAPSHERTDEEIQAAEQFKLLKQESELQSQLDQLPLNSVSEKEKNLVAVSSHLLDLVREPEVVPDPVISS